METAEQGTVERPRRSRIAKAIAVAALAAASATIAIVVLDLLVDRSAAERSFISSNIACLRCHAELLARLDDPSVHQPFLTSHCTSCHVVHARRGAVVVAAGHYGAWRRLELTLDRLALDLVWRVLSGPGLVAESGPASDTGAAPARTGDGGLRVSEESLCWTCHGDLASERFAAHIHAPFGEGQCTSCHHPHSSSTRFLLHGDTEDLCVSCHRIGPELVASQVHLPFFERRCVACHRPHSSPQHRLLAAEERALCFGCHGDVERLVVEAVQHAPFSSACSGCHEPHAADVAPLLTEAPPELCYGCHGEVRPQFALPSAHPVPGLLRCGDCHLPHASGFGGLLPVAQRSLCLGCHRSVLSDLALPVVHEPVGSDACTGCHTPHGSSAAPLLQAAVPSLCFTCHPGKVPRTKPARTVRARRSDGGRHGASAPPASDRSATSLPPERLRPRGEDPITSPAGSSVRVPAVPAHPVDGTDGINCSRCHRAHSSDHDTLFVRPVDALCGECHDDGLALFDESAHGGVRCDGCHSVHDAVYAPGLKKENPAVCLGCHKRYGAGNVHPAGPGHYDTQAKAPLTCTSSCHAPHGSRYAHMLQVPYGTDGYGKDYVCLVCHRQVGITY